MREILFRGQLRRKGEKVNMAGEPLPSIWKYGGCAQYGGGAVIYQAEPEIKKFPVYGHHKVQGVQPQEQQHDLPVPGLYEGVFEFAAVRCVWTVISR